MSEKLADLIENAFRKLVQGNETFVKIQENNGNISAEIRNETVQNGQKPYAVVVTCSDSRVPPEHIFSAGIGELFVIRTAGQVIGDFELGSVEYGAEHLGAKIILVLGHNHCGAVAAAMGGHGEGHIQKILDEIIPVIKGENDVIKCEKLNIDNSVRRILESKIIRHLVDEKKVKVISGKYDLESGMVNFF